MTGTFIRWDITFCTAPKTLELCGGCERNDQRLNGLNPNRRLSMSEFENSRSAEGCTAFRALEPTDRPVPVEESVSG